MNSASDRGAQPPAVLAVDDEPVVLSFISAALQFSGFRVFLASSGAEAVEILRTHPEAITVALVDLHMLGLDGFATLRTLQQLKPSLRCCLMTGAASASGENLQTPHAVRVLAKPFSLSELVGCVRALHEEALAGEDDKVTR